MPGLEQAEAELEEAQTAATEAAARADAVRARHDALERHRRLLWEDGCGVRAGGDRAFRLLGFGVTGGYGQPLTLTSDGATASSRRRAAASRWSNGRTSDCSGGWKSAC